MSSRSLLIERSAEPTLPDWRAVSAACRGDLPSNDLILRWARALACLHRERRVSPHLADRIDRRRNELVEAIANWVTYIGPDLVSAHRVGRAVDALAAAYVDAEFALASAISGAALSVHDAWLEAGARAVEWADLVAEIVDGQPPIPWPPEHLTPQGIAIERNSRCRTLQPIHSS